MFKILALSLVVAAASALSTAALANSRSVDLRSPDGSVSLQGAFIEFTDGNYRIDTPLGEFKVSADRVDCLGSGCPFFDTNEPDIRIVVTDTWESELVLRLTEAFARNIKARFEVFDLPRKDEIFFQVSGTTGAPIRFAILQATEGEKVAALKSGYADAAITPVVLQVPGLTSTTLATEAMVPVRHPAASLDEITAQQLAEALTVETRSDPLERQAHTSAPEIGNDQPEFSSIVTVSQNEPVVRLVPARHVQNGLAVRLLDSCGLPTRSDRFAIKAGKYPYARPIYLQHHTDLSESDAARFVSFLSSRSAAVVLADHGLFDQWLEVFPMNAHVSNRLVDAGFDSAHEAEVHRKLRVLRDKKERLSSTFYFPTGSVDTDHIEPAELERLVTYLADLPDGTSIVFAGFTDDVGASSANKELSYQRASRLADAVKNLGGQALSNHVINVAGFGEIAPVTCNSDEFGRSLNRRVEIWLSNAGADSRS